MMHKVERLQKHTLHLREGDYAILQVMFPKKGAAYVVRRLVANYVDKNTVKTQEYNNDE